MKLRSPQKDIAVSSGLTAWNAKNGSVDLNAELLGFGNKKAEAEQLETGNY